MDTLSFDRNLLGEERYEQRMFDSYLYAGVLFGILSILMVPSIILLNKIFRMYLQVIKTLSERDVQKLIKLNESAIFYERYLPSYIIRGKSVVVFQFLKETTINFDDIKAFYVRNTYYKGYTGHVTIRTFSQQYQFTFYGNEFKVRNLVTEAKTANTSIAVNSDWRN